MNCIAGLETISGGAILVDDADISGMSPKDRDIAMVFQSYALYPTMSVRDNIITVMTAVRYGRRQNRPRYSYSASASRPLYGEDIRVITPNAPRPGPRP